MQYSTNFYTQSSLFKPISPIGRTNQTKKILFQRIHLDDTLFHNLKTLTHVQLTMIDTIILILHKDTYQITHPEIFTPSAHWIMLNKPIAGIISKQNPTKKELKAGIYKPHLTVSHRLNAALIYEPLLTK